VTTPRKIAANRQNALRSTGPRTLAGKAIVSQNRARSSLFSAGSILPGLESRARWQEHLQTTVAALAPVGQVELALAERVALLFWRLSRITTFEQDVTHGARSRSYDEVLAVRQPLLKIAGVDNINDVLKRLAQARATLHALQRFATQPPESLLAGRHAESVLSAIARLIPDFDLDHFSAPEIVPDGIPWADIPVWTVHRLRRLVTAIASATSHDPERLLSAAIDAARLSVNRERAAQRSFDRQVRDLRAERLLPDPAPLDRLVRYERHLTEQLDRTLKQLHTLQRARHADPAPLPIPLPIDVGSPTESEVSSGSKPPFDPPPPGQSLPEPA
jgi:hypothetical protein